MMPLSVVVWPGQLVRREKKRGPLVRNLNLLMPQSPVRRCYREVLKKWCLPQGAKKETVQRGEEEREKRELEEEEEEEMRSLLPHQLVFLVDSTP